MLRPERPWLTACMAKPTCPSSRCRVAEHLFAPGAEHKRHVGLPVLDGAALARHQELAASLEAYAAVACELAATT